MTSIKQIEANRLNALKSTGPRTAEGKARSRRNAVRHGLTAETVIEGHENPADYKAFEGSITADYDPQTAVERELVLRLVSLLWRLRRAIAIETGLLELAGERMEDFTKDGDNSGRPELLNVAVCSANIQLDVHQLLQTDREILGRPPDIAGHFLRLAKIDGGAFERVLRY